MFVEVEVIIIFTSRHTAYESPPEKLRVKQVELKVTSDKEDKNFSYQKNKNMVNAYPWVSRTSFMALIVSWFLEEEDGKLSAAMGRSGCTFVEQICGGSSRCCDRTTCRQYFLRKIKHIIENQHFSINSGQLEAVQWCKVNKCRGYKKALTAVDDDGLPLIPRISDARTINRRLYEQIQTGEEHRYCSILTLQEEEYLVRYLKNKNRACQSVTEYQPSQVVLAC